MCVRGRKGKDTNAMEGFSFAPWSSFLDCFFKLQNEKVTLSCLQRRLIVAERRDAGTPHVYFHTCCWLRAYFAAGTA